MQDFPELQAECVWKALWGKWIPDERTCLEGKGLIDLNSNSSAVRAQDLGSRVSPGRISNPVLLLKDRALVQVSDCLSFRAFRVPYTLNWPGLAGNEGMRKRWKLV